MAASERKQIVPDKKTLNATYNSIRETLAACETRCSEIYKGQTYDNRFFSPVAVEKDAKAPAEAMYVHTLLDTLEVTKAKANQEIIKLSNKDYTDVITTTFVTFNKLLTEAFQEEKLSGVKKPGGFDAFDIIPQQLEICIKLCAPYLPANVVKPALNA